MLLLQPLLAIFGLAVFAAGYSLPGAYERLYFYYAYRLDTLTSGALQIAAKCGTKENPCDLNKFMEFISEKELKGVSITAEKLPEVEGTAQAIFKHADSKDLTGPVKFGRVFTKENQSPSSYSDLFQKLGNYITGKMRASPAEGVDAAELDLVKDRLYDAMLKVHAARTKAAEEEFKPFPKQEPPFQVIFKKAGVPDYAAMIKENPTVQTTKEELTELWRENIKGGHIENIKSLGDSIKAIRDYVPSCNKNNKHRRDGLCGEISEDILATEEGEPSIPSGPGAKPIPDEGKLAELAESVSEKEFGELATARGLTILAKERWSLDIKEARTKLLGYKKLTAESPKLSPVKGLGSGALAAVGGALWVTGIVDAFTKDASALDRAAAITSIIPFVGCGVNAAADVEKGTFDGLDTTMCVLGDGLLVTPLAPLGIIVHVFRAIINLLKPPPLPTVEGMQKVRDGSWARFLDDKVYTYLYSDRFLFPEKGFRDKLNSSLAIEALAVVSEGAQSIAVANITGQTALEASTADEDKAKIQEGSLAAANEIRAGISNEIIRRQRDFLLGLPSKLKESQELALKPLAEQYNKDFIAEVTSQKMVGKYKQIFIGDPEVPGSQRDNEAEVRSKLSEIGAHLTKTPVSVPGVFDIAYVVGQSKGLEGIDPVTLSPQAFVKSQAPELSEYHLNTLSLHHTLEVARLLQGKLTEDRLSNLWPSDDTKSVRPLQTLIALKYGRTYDEWKIMEAKRVFSGPSSFFIDEQDPKAVRYLTHPDIPPAGGNPENPPYLGLVVGLSTEVINNLSGELKSGYLHKDIAAMKAQVVRLQEMLKQREFQTAMVRLEITKSQVNDDSLTSPLDGKPPQAPASAKRMLARSRAVFRARHGVGAF